MECTVESCDRETRTKASPYCEKHYSRWKRHGDPEIVLKDHTPAVERWKTNYDYDNRTGCWIWRGPFTRGYGFIQEGRKKRHMAHRFVYEQVIGKIPDDVELDHKCRNEACINPWHMDPKTHLINVRRGDAGIKNAAKEQCDHGHEFTPENTRIQSSGGRECCACRRRINREYMRKRRAASRA